MSVTTAARLTRLIAATKLDLRLAGPLVLSLAVASVGYQIWSGIAGNAGLHWDFANFYDAGRKAAAGELGNLYDPAALIAGEPPQGGLAFYGTPLSAWLYSPLASLSPETAAKVFKACGTLATLAGLILLYRRYLFNAERTNYERARVLFVIAVALFQPFWEVYHVGGQTTPLVFAALVGAMLLHVNGQTLWTVLLFAFVVVIKPVFAVAFVVLGALAGWRFCLTGVGVGAVVGGFSIWQSGWPLHLVFLKHIAVHYPKPWQYNSSVTAVLDSVQTWLTSSASAAFPFQAVGTFARLALSAAFLFSVLRTRSRLQAAADRRHADFLTALMCGLILMPVVWEHYLAFLFIPLAYCISIHSRLPVSAAALVGVTLLLSVLQNVAVVSRVQSIIEFDTPLEIVAVALLKSAPLSLTALLFVLFARPILTAGLSGQRLRGLEHLPAPADLRAVELQGKQEAVPFTGAAHAD